MGPAPLQSVGVRRIDPNKSEHESVSFTLAVSPHLVDLEAEPTTAEALRRYGRDGTDTTVARLGPETESLLQWTMSVPGPEYPAELRSQRKGGQVIARFAVDTNGRVVRGTAVILSEPHRGFGRSVCQFLTRAQLRPVPVDGRKRSVTVSASPFEFSFGR